MEEDDAQRAVPLAPVHLFCCQLPEDLCDSLNAAGRPFAEVMGDLPRVRYRKRGALGPMTLCPERNRHPNMYPILGANS